jgi:hypothetical protein
MSKVDAQRAMREARYAQRSALVARAAPQAPTGTPAPQQAEPQRRPPANPVLPDALPCGHRAISGRTCTRERGHTEKSHRYA